MVSTKERPLIDHDADDWLFDYHSGLAEWHNRVYGLNNAYGVLLKKEHFKSWGLTGTLGGTKKEAIKKVDMYYLTDSFLKLSPDPEAQDVVRTLALHFRQGVCTSRPDSTREDTYAQFQRHYKGLIPLEMIYFTNFQPKDNILLKHRPRAFTDDCFENHVKLLNNPEIRRLVRKKDLKLCMITRPWNEDLSDHPDKKYMDDVIRLKRPKDLLKHVL